MAFTSINIQNFRGIKSLEMDDFGQVNVFVGKNSIGKSSVLEAFFMTAAISNGAIPLNLNSWRGMDSLAFLGLNLFFHNFHYQDQESQNLPHFIASLKRPDEVRHLTLIPVKDTLFQATPDFNAPMLSGLLQDFSIHKGQNSSQNYQTKTVIQSLSPPSMQTIPPQGYQEKMMSYFISPRMTTVDAAVLRDLIVKKRGIGIVKALKNIDERIEDIVLVQNSLYCDIGLSELMPLAVMGDGIRKMLFILGVIATNPDGVVCLDEIENGFHYSSITVLWDSLLKAAKEFNVQVFATTHSYECLAALAKVQEANLFGEDIVRVFRLERDGEEHRAVKMTGEDMSIMIGNNWELR